MSRSALSVTSDILVLKILINDAIKSLRGGATLPQERRRSLSKAFHRYIRNDGMDRLRPNAISKLRGAQPLPFGVVRTEAANYGAELLAVIDKFALGQLNTDETTTLVEFLTRVGSALDRSRKHIPIGRYL
jgi:hypothetical protein